MSAGIIQIIELPSHFLQVQLSGLKDVVNHHRENGQQVQFDAREVERVDGAAVQFMVAVGKLQSATEFSGPLVVNVNEMLVKAFDDMGVNALIDICPEENERSSDKHVA